MNLARKIFEANNRFSLIEKHDKILIAFSGGVDSLVLSYLLIKLKHVFDVDIALAHFNHQLREDAKKDEEFCIDFAKKYNVDIFVDTYDIKSLKGNIENNAREKRYEFLQNIAKKHGFNKIATAHHLDDLAETVILWLTKGFGIKGFKAFEKNIIRPLILCTKEEIINYAKKENLTWCEDYTNYDISLSRNLIRHKVIPLLESINPNFLNTVFNEILVLQEENRFLEEYTKDIISKIDYLDIKSLKTLPKTIQRRVIRKVFNIDSFQKTELVLKLLENAKQIKIDKSTILERKNGKIFYRHV